MGFFFIFCIGAHAIAHHISSFLPLPTDSSCSFTHLISLLQLLSLHACSSYGSKKKKLNYFDCDVRVGGATSGLFFPLFSLKDCSMAAAQWPVARWLTATSSVHVTYALVITRMTLQNGTYAQEKCVTDRNSSSAFALHCCSTLSYSVCIGCYFLASTTIKRQHITSSIAANYVVYKQN